jgi:hypothetical protein
MRHGHLIHLYFLFCFGPAAIGPAANTPAGFALFRWAAAQYAQKSLWIVLEQVFPDPG